MISETGYRVSKHTDRVSRMKNYCNQNN